MIGTKPNPKSTCGKDNRFDLARGFGTHDVDRCFGPDQSAVHAIEQRYAAGRLDTKSRKFIDMMLQASGIATGPPGDYEIGDLDPQNLTPSFDKLYHLQHS